MVAVQNGINPAMAAMAGAVVGAGMAAAAVALADKKNRDKGRSRAHQCQRPNCWSHG